MKIRLGHIRIGIPSQPLPILQEGPRLPILAYTEEHLIFHSRNGRNNSGLAVPKVKVRVCRVSL